METTFKPDGSPETFLDKLNPVSLEIVTGAFGEKCLEEAQPGERFQFERLGYYVEDRPARQTEDSVAGVPVFNTTVGLRDT
jgi:glutaminyl-tRNA synthetase